MGKSGEEWGRVGKSGGNRILLAVQNGYGVSRMVSKLDSHCVEGWLKDIWSQRKKSKYGDA